MRNIVLLSFAAVLAGCGSSTEETTTTQTQSCTSDDAGALRIGRSLFGEFAEYQKHEEVTLVAAPQGGFGVAIYIETDGLVANEEVALTLDVLYQGKLYGSFFSEQQLFCQESGYGMLWDVVVGFDPAVFPTTDDLIAFNGEVVTLQVMAVDKDGDSATSMVDLTITL
jgi:hypothetical protein